MQLFSQSGCSSKNAHYETHWRETTQMQTMRLHYNTFNQSEEPQKDPLSHYKTVRDGRRDVAAEALAHINLGTHLKIYNGRKVIQSYVLIQHLLFIQGKSHVSARSVNSRTHKIDAHAIGILSLVCHIEGMVKGLHPRHVKKVGSKH